MKKVIVGTIVLLIALQLSLSGFAIWVIIQWLGYIGII